MDSSPLWVQFLVIIVLTAINAFFAAAELAYVSVNDREIDRLIEEENSKSAKRVKKLTSSSDDFLSTIQVAITLAGFLSSASAAQSFTDIVADWLPNFTGVETVSTVIVTLILSYFTLVFGELYPKQLALQMPEKVALASSGVVTVVQKIFKPIVWLLSASTGLLQKITPIDFTEDQASYSREAMRLILSESREEGSIDEEEFSMLQGVLSLDNKMAREIMTPRVDAQMVDINDDNDKIFYAFIDSSFSRLPVYDDDKDNVIGTIHIKNVFKAFYEAGYDYDKIDFHSVIGDPFVVPSTIYIDDLLLQFQNEQSHMAVLKDEYGGVEGIITLEDVIEEIVGDIEDEYDLGTEKDISVLDPKTWQISGGLPVDKFNDFFKEKIQVEEVDTIAGLVLYVINYLPDDEEEVSIRVNDYVLKTLEIEDGRIREILVELDEERDIVSDYYLNVTDPEDSMTHEEYEEYSQTIEENEQED